MSETPRTDTEPTQEPTRTDPGTDEIDDVNDVNDTDGSTESGGNDTKGREAEIDPGAGARGALYSLLARAFEHPDERLYEAFATGTLAATVAELCERSGLDLGVESEEIVPEDLVTDDGDRATLDARYNDLFEIGYAEYTDRTDGSLDTTAPPVPLSESTYREDVSWNDVNLDLARAYDYFDLEIGAEDRKHHDALGLELEFAGYLARREAVVDPGAGRARLDFLDRHLRVLAKGIRDRLAEEPGTDVYGPLAVLLEDLVAADRADLAARFEGGDRSGEEGAT